MDLHAIAFYTLATVMLAAAGLVITARNPVHSVLFLILAFFSGAGLFVLLGAEFLAMLLIVVYVGAVAVLFLFVVMMLDVDFVSLRTGFAQYLPIGLGVAGLLLVEMVMVSGAVASSGAASKIKATAPVGGPSNIEQIGRVLYTDYVYFFQAAGLVLLVAMIGAIVLTLRHKPGVRRQDIADQTARTRKTGLAIVKVATGEGISE
jgi:NADH-quinone oxidoreductase subunit J